MKYRNEWEVIKNAASLRKARLSNGLVYLLFAMREVADKSEEEAFGIKDVRGYGEQCEMAINSVILNERRYIKYISDPKNEIMDFIEFMGTKGGPEGRGWTSQKDWHIKVGNKIKEIMNEYSRDKKVGD